MMDPVAALRLINDDADDDALHGLAQWLARGGFMPTGAPGETMHPSICETAMESYRAAGLDDLAAAVNVALVNGDASGLAFYGDVT